MIEKKPEFEQEHALLKRKYANLEKKYIDERKTQAIHIAMRGMKYNSREQVVKLSWDDLTYDLATNELSAAGFKTVRDYFRNRAKQYPYELADYQQSQSLLMNRSEMTWQQKADYITEHGMEAYLELPE